MSKRAAFNILAFLQKSIEDGTIRTDDAEGIEVAIQCISEAFGVDLDNVADKTAYSIEPETLATVLESHVKAAPSVAPAAAKSAAPASPETKAKAEKAKSLGNQLMAAKDYPGAIKAYGDAIELDGSAPTYYSNRAAAHAQLQAHDAAISDARTAIDLDPKFTKAYSRLGHALFSSGLYPEAVEAYEKGLVLDPTNATMKSSLATAKSRVPSHGQDEDDDEAGTVTPAAARGGAGFPGMPAGFPGMPAGGGMPDFASMMNNPAIMQMAQSMMANGGLEQLMQNPMLQSMMGGAGGGGMPDLGALMNDPQMRAMAESMGMGGAGGAGARGGARNGESDSNADMYS